MNLMKQWDVTDYGPDSHSCRIILYCQTWLPGPIPQFSTEMPDWMDRDLTPEDLNLTLESLPIPLEAPFPQGIFLQEAIQVNPRHDTHKRQYRNIAFIIYIIYGYRTAISLRTSFSILFVISDIV
jgi:hypothetical protein